MYHLIIPKNTKVLNLKSNSVVEIADTVYTNAEKVADGGFKYFVGNREYYTSAGVCRFVQA